MNNHCDQIPYNGKEYRSQHFNILKIYTQKKRGKKCDNQKYNSNKQILLDLFTLIYDDLELNRQTKVIILPFAAFDHNVECCYC